MNEKNRKPAMTQARAERTRPDILIRASEGTLTGKVKSVKDRASAERAIAQLLGHSRRRGHAAGA